MVHMGRIIQRQNERKWTNFDATSGTILTVEVTVPSVRITK
jgi:hypothetical protein